jgi:tRNA pseudouridine38-40 synthase
MSPFQRRFAWHVSRDLDLRAMNEAARELLGDHDFSCFQAKADPTRGQRTASTATRKRTTTRTMSRSGWNEEPLAGGGRILIYEIAGTGFLKYMVRAVVGTLVEVGDGRRTPASLRDLLDSRDRAAAGPTAPPIGLYLVRVDYDAAAPVSF